MKKIIGLFAVIAVGVLPLTITAHQGHHMHSEVEYRPRTLEELTRFHGHLGPYAVLGNRIGEHAITVHEIPPYFGLTVKVECPDSPPHSCLIDGLQISTGATMGKRNIEHTPSESIQVTIIEDLTGKKVIYTLKSSTKKQLKKWWEKDEPSVEERGKIIFHSKAEELFDIKLIEDR